MRIRTLQLVILILATIPTLAQTPDAPAEKPLPDIPTLMHAVEDNQRKSEALQQNYIYSETRVFSERDSHENVKKTRSNDFEVFWLNGVRVGRRLTRDGKPLTPDELKAENARIDDVVKKSRERRDKADANDKETDSRGRDEITVARILELGAFSNPRRELLNDRPTIIVDYLGDPHAKTRNSAESAFKELAGTLWIDEQDQTIQHLEAHFDHDFKIAGGLAASVRKGTWFRASFTRINNEVWLPAQLEGDGHARYLLFFAIDGHLLTTDSNYRKFKATSTLLPDTSTPTPPQ